ncbi:hypothetical protein OOT00_13900 [Desulfobotulus sp. H1]|uniref:HAMP domain-containing protein n=1 Tax=Desulfobotulus pelophilus TaxID=2823377 RepID=A0ABT3NC83_9BACT|nr:hypothetical protein [Desulfobotulus pelophilus]MCW7755078.1 hypothetical protein [Desulfobotulus pelophilus]
MAVTGHKRRTYILAQTSQPKYIFSYFILFCLSLLVFSCLFSFMSMNTTTIVYANNEISVGSTPHILLSRMLGSGWIVVTIGGFLLFLFSILMTHRVAGPAYRIEKSLSEMLAGSFGRKTILRQYDELKPIARQVTALSILIAERQDDLRKHNREMEERIQAMPLNKEDKAALMDKNKEVETILQAFHAQDPGPLQ